MVAVLGDLAFYHDMNGLFAVRENRLNVLFVVINNDGGGIFHQLPVARPGALDADTFERLFGTPHGLGFADAARQVGLAYHQPPTLPAFETALAEDELLVEIRVPKMPDATWSFQKFNRRAQDWAIVGAAVVVNGGVCGVGLVNMDSQPVRAAATEASVDSGGTAAEAAALAADGLEPSADLNASVEYRCHLARVLTRRGLEESGL